MRMARIVIALLALGAWLAPVSQASTTPDAPAWQISLIPLPTNFKPGSSGTISEAPIYRLIATNVGGASTSGPAAITVTLPSGLKPVGPQGDNANLPAQPPACTESGQIVSCAIAGPVPPGRWVGVRIPLEVTASAGVLTTKASIGGGGAATETTTSTTEVSPTPPGFGFLSGSVGLGSLLTNADGSASRQAGSRPYQLTLNFGFPTEQPEEEGGTTGAGHLRDLTTELPRGLIVNPTATSVRCTEAQLIINFGAKSNCPLASQVGTVAVMSEISGPLVVISNLYNMVPPPGSPAELGFDAINVGVFVHVAGGVRSDGDYGLSADARDITARANNPILSVQTQLWGDPSGSSHDEIRGECRVNSSSSCPVPVAERTNRPLLTMPSACSGPPVTAAQAKSWEEPESALPHRGEVQATDLAGNPVGVSGCSLLNFEPKLRLRPDTSAAESPTGVHVDLQVPQSEGQDELATSNAKDTTVTFPAGIALNPAAAGGLAACTPTQIGLKTSVREKPIYFNADPPRCPESSKIGTVEVDTPLLDHPLPGSVYVAQPYANPFGTLLGVYVVIDDPRDGIVAKLAGRTKVIDEATGQLRTTFEENPELPFEDFKVDLFGGPRAALRTPSTCGSFITESVETPWSGTPPANTIDSFTINQGANGSPCVLSEAAMPDSPGFEAGTSTPIAATYSPFLGRLQRADGTQQFKSLNLTLPPGLSGKLAGIPPCSDAAIGAAAVKTGTEELASPSCPAASQVGEVKVGAGAGSQPYYTTGKIYLSGPYDGGSNGRAPVSAAIITPAVAGPFDLGTVVVRAALYINPTTAQITVKSDPVPRVLQGIPLEVRDIQVSMSRDDFTLNPTSCTPMSITGEAISVLDHVAPLSNRFQVGGCRGLDFEPKLALHLFGKTSRGAHPRLRAVLTAKPGEANIARASVALPRSEFLENAHIGSVCTRVQFAADTCPARSIYGHGKAITPLLDEALEGPVYLRSSSHELPDLVMTLKGPSSRPIKIELAGRIDSNNGGIRNTFDLVPDQPVSKFILSMQGGKKGLLVNSRNLCARTYRATAKFNGQNGKVHDFYPVMKNDCGKQHKGKPERRR